jgi:hypothetical protein
MRKTFPIKLLSLFILLLSGFLKSSAQINADGQQHNLSYNGTYQDLVVPNNTLITKITFSLSGADGGAAILRMGQNLLIGFVEAFRYSSGGGNGAVVNCTFLVGSGPGKIPLGSTVRFIIGQKGVTGVNNISLLTDAGTGSDYGGGGGGTAILYKRPGSTVWTLLAVAGGGGGAYQGVFAPAIPIGDDGGAGEESENGADGGGGIINGNGVGGINGNGGEASFGYSGETPAGAGGGGRFTNGVGLVNPVDIAEGNIGEEFQVGEGGAGATGGPEFGGYGGTREFLPKFIFEFRNGGFGYGGGGLSVGTGGGGGGYSGGGGGGLFFGGGGGGSYLNGIRETGNVSGGGSDTEPDDGIASYQVILNHPPVANCKNKTIYLDANGQASISSSDIDNGSSDEDGDALTFGLSRSSFSCSDVGVNNITLTVTDAFGATATCTAVVSVFDNLSPTITCAVNSRVNCASDVPAVNINSVTAADNCSVIVTHIGDVITNQTCANRFTLTRTYKATDPSGNFVTCAQVITVNDDTPPQITGLSPSQPVLWPPNHTMRDVTINYTTTDDCTNATTSISVSSNEPINGTADGDTDPDWEIIDGHHIQLRAERAGNGTGRIYTITITINDGCNTAVTASTEVRVTHNITGPVTGHPFRVGSTVDFAGEFWDKPGNKHSSKWLIDNSSVKGIVTEPTATKNGKVTGSYKFITPGVYKLQMNTTDQNGVTSFANTNGDLEEIVVIYDPNGGYTYGGGWFASQAGALVSDPLAEGKASYGFTVNYFKNSTYPKGETQFEFKVGEFEFNALNFDYLVIDGAKAQFRGTGKITGGQSGVGFVMTVIDGNADGSGVDRIRMKIYHKTTGVIIYDNQPGVSDATEPVAAVGTNSSVVIYSSSSNNVKTPAAGAETMEVSQGFGVKAHPNPSNTNFTIMVTGSLNGQVKMQVADLYGRLIETRILDANSRITIGDKYRPGVYFVRFEQDQTRRQLKLVKLPQ